MTAAAEADRHDPDEASVERACTTERVHCSGISLPGTRDFEGVPQVQKTVRIHKQKAIHVKMKTPHQHLLNTCETPKRWR